jgi:hypothetical protein
VLRTMIAFGELAIESRLRKVGQSKRAMRAFGS